MSSEGSISNPFRHTATAALAFVVLTLAPQDANANREHDPDHVEPEHAA